MTPERYRKLRRVLDRRQPDLAVLLDDVHKPHNLSAVLRTCDATGVFDAHAVSRFGNFTPHRASSAGAGKWVRLHLHEQLDDAIAAVRAQGHVILAAHLSDRAVDFRSIDYTRPTTILLGAEKWGVGEAAAAAADHHVVIPMVGMAASLNVSVAAAVILYEAQRQREAAGFYETPRLDPETYRTTLFRWGHPALAKHCDRHGWPYPPIGPDGEVLSDVAPGV